MLTADNIVTMDNMRKDTRAVLKKISTLKQPMYLFSRSTPKAVLLDIDYFAQMQEILDDHLDSQELLSINQKEISTALDWNKVK